MKCQFMPEAENYIEKNIHRRITSNKFLTKKHETSKTDCPKDYQLKSKMCSGDYKYRRKQI